MPSSGIFFLPSSAIVTPESKIVDSLLIHFTKRFSCVSLPKWNLQHKLFREVPLPNTPQNETNSKNQETRYLQVLSLPYQSENTHVAITATTQSSSQPQEITPNSSSESAGAGNVEPATVVAVPKASTDGFVQLLHARFGPLWTPRQTTIVADGHTLEIGSFRIRLGELRQAQPQAQVVSKGVVVEIEYNGKEQEEDDDWGIAEGLIRAFWSDLGIKGAREYFRTAGEEDGFGNVRQWCEVLRLLR